MKTPTDHEGAGREDAHVLEPLCVDLDGTLVATDTLIEMIIVALRRSPLAIVFALLALLSGKARFKDELARRVALPVQNLPYRPEVLEYLRAERRAGRRLVLSTAANHRVAEAVAAYLGLFDEVIASDRSINLRGPAKAERLVARFGAGGFAYAGNDAHDLPVWSRASQAIVVDAPASVIKAITVPIAREFASDRKEFFRPLLRAMRPHQWVKNLLVFVPVITSVHPADGQAMMTATVVFLGFCVLASGTYLFNDILDVEVDRQHDRKRFRPFAAGRVPLCDGFLVAAGMIATGLAVGFAVDAVTGAIMTLYLFITLSYSLRFKSVPVIDVFWLAVLYTIRIFAGAMATGFFVSNWLMTFSFFLFLSLAFLKRLVEIMPDFQTDTVDVVPGRNYFTNEQIPLAVMGVASAQVAVVVLALYVDSATASAAYRAPDVLWAFVPLCAFWTCWLWLEAWRGNVDDDPIVFAARKVQSWIIAAAGAIAYAIAAVGLP